MNPGKTRSTLSKTSVVIFAIALLYGITLYYTVQALNHYVEGTQDANDLLVYAQDIRYYDQVLTLESMLGAATGEPIHALKYNQYLNELNAALDHVVDLESNYTTIIHRIDDANAQLVTFERQAFDLGMRHETEKALMILHSETYTGYKEVYQQEFEHLIDELYASHHQLYVDLKNNLYLSLWWVFIFLTLLILGLVLVYRIINQRMNLEKRFTEISNRLLSIEEQDTNETYQWVLESLATQFHVDYVYLYLKDANSILNIWQSSKDFEVLSTQLQAFSLSHRLENDQVDRYTLNSTQSNHRDMLKTMRIHGIMRMANGSNHHQTIEIGIVSLKYLHRLNHEILSEIHGILKLLTLSIHQTLYKENLYQLATLDSLTGLLNRRSFLERLDSELLRFHRYPEAFSFLMLDLDLFKLVNDEYGHSAGDMVLKDFANHVKSCLRDIDSFGRVGGEEFSIILPNTNIEGAQHVAERIRQKVESGTLTYENHTIHYTVSIGLTLNHKDDQSLTLMERADKALYLAKNSGRNKVSTL